MPIPFIMPKMDMDQESVTITEWLKQEGETITKGEPVIVVETDKLTSEIEAPATGTLASILYHKHEEAPVTQVVAYILAEGETIADLPAPEKPEEVEAKAAEESPAQQASAPVQLQVSPIAQKLAADLNVDLNQLGITDRKITRADIEAFAAAAKEKPPRPSATPAARFTARENNLDLAGISGSGPGGRVQLADVQAARAAATSQAAGELRPATVLPEVKPGEIKPFTGTRKRIAERLTQSYQDVPHIYLTVHVDMSPLNALRQRANADKTRDSVSMTAFLVKLLALTLARHPYLNAKLSERGVELLGEYNIGVATALEDGLIVPVIHHADQLPIRTINTQLRELSAKARTGSLVRQEVDGGTFTISNLGMLGISEFTAIINPPQSAILAVGAIERRVVAAADDEIEIKPMMSITLGCDHRVVDGAVAAAFLRDLKTVLEEPSLALL